MQPYFISSAAVIEGGICMFLLWRRHRRRLIPFLLIAPGTTLFAVVILSSAVQSLWISLHEWDGFGPMLWVGFGNFRELFKDPQFYVSLRNNIIWLAIFMLSPPLGLAIALLVNQKIRGMSILKSLFFRNFCEYHIYDIEGPSKTLHSANQSECALNISMQFI